MHNLICIVLTLIIFSFDRITKIKILDNQLINNSIYVNDFINIDLAWNTGIGFGLFNFNSGITYHLITTVIFTVIIFIIICFYKSKNFEKYAYTLILGGALGNVYDRLKFQAVPDFIDLHIENFHWFTFNIADIFITIGIVLLILIQIILKENAKN